MAEKRKSDRSICVKIGAKVRFKIEFFDAAQWPELTQPDSERFRLRINRRWHDGPDGEMLFLDMVQVAALVGMLTSGENLSLPPKPDLPRGAPVKAPCRVLAGETMYELTRTGTEPILGHDGRWYVDIFLFGKGGRFVPVDDLIIQPRRR